MSEREIGPEVPVNDSIARRSTTPAYIRTPAPAAPEAPAPFCGQHVDLGQQGFICPLPKGHAGEHADRASGHGYMTLPVGRTRDDGVTVRFRESPEKVINEPPADPEEVLRPLNREEIKGKSTK